MKPKSIHRRVGQHLSQRSKVESNPTAVRAPLRNDARWRQTEGPPAPPPSPASISGSDDYVANLRFLQSLDVYREEQVYVDNNDAPAEVIAVKTTKSVPLKDEDHERRSSYCKNSITNGEVMIEIGEYSICQFFINGIEYHYCVSLRNKAKFWNLPEEIREECSQWYLECPRHKRKKSGLIEPPLFLEFSTPDDIPSFHTHVATY